MTPLRISKKNFWPGWRHEHSLMITAGLTKQRQGRLSRQVFKSCCGVNQTSIKENPSFPRAGGNLVGNGHRKGALQKRGLIHPRKG